MPPIKKTVQYKIKLTLKKGVLSFNDWTITWATVVTMPATMMILITRMATKTAMTIVVATIIVISMTTMMMLTKSTMITTMPINFNKKFNL